MLMRPKNKNIANKKWNNSNQTKSRASLIQFDICEFYPSINEDLLDRAIEYAKTHINIEQESINIIKTCRKSIVFSEGKIWRKKR